MISENNERVEFRGGLLGLTLPFAVLFIGIMWLALSGKALPMAFWVPTLFSILAALLLAKKPADCARAIISGMSSEMVAIMLMAWFLAGITAQLLKATGLIQGLIWLSLSVGLKGAYFPLVTFVIGCLLSTATGTAIGTVIALGPILYPVGVALGANPPVMVAAIVCAAYFGDNIAPVSDTTIASAYTQGTDVPRVVKTRLKYAFIAAGLSCVLFVVFGGGGETLPAGAPFAKELSPDGLIMLLVPALLITLMFREVHLIVALIFSGAFGILLGIASGLLSPASLLVINMDQFTVGGIIPDGINSLMDIAVFAFLLMGLVGLLERGGFLEMVTERTETLHKDAKERRIDDNSPSHHHEPSHRREHYRHHHGRSPGQKGSCAEECRLTRKEAPISLTQSRPAQCASSPTDSARCSHTCSQGARERLSISAFFPRSRTCSTGGPFLPSCSSPS